MTLSHIILYIKKKKFLWHIYIIATCFLMTSSSKFITRTVTPYIIFNNSSGSLWSLQTQIVVFETLHTEYCPHLLTSCCFLNFTSFHWGECFPHQKRDCQLQRQQKAWKGISTTTNNGTQNRMNALTVVPPEKISEENFIFKTTACGYFWQTL